MVSFKKLLFASCLSTVYAKPLFRREGLSFNYDGQKLRGVNLGGWLVLEPWITPSLFTGSYVDEYTLTQTLGKNDAKSLLKQHWDTWITQDDFKEIASFGLNHVRIPIGYWAVNPLDGDPYVQGQLDYLDKAIEWARDAGLKVLVDLHGAPGSQNGFDNSGKYGSIDWTQGDSVSQTVTAVKSLAERYASATDVVSAIELLNEPAGWTLDKETIKQFYYDGFGTVQAATSNNVAVVIHDAFLDVNTEWNGFMSSGFDNVILDTHIYQVFSNGEVSRTTCEHVQNACSNSAKLSSTDKWTIVGEWTGALTDCAKWLNGFNKGARYDGTFDGSSTVYGDCQTKREGTVDGLLDVDKTNIAYFIEAQLDAYESRTGWVFWTWKTESAPEWHFQNLTKAGLIPQPLSSRKFGNQCGTSECLVPGN